MTALRAIVPTRILRKWDELAAIQLCAVAARLSEELDQACESVSAAVDREWQAIDCANFWQQNAMQMQERFCEMTGAEPGLTQNGTLVLVPAGAHS